jgi:glutamate dehydrogenase (NAD(P)+)
MSAEREPRFRLIWTDPVTGRKGYAVIDRFVNGLAGGGTRMREGVTLEEVERLARTMSYKNGAFNLPGGGAKGGVDIDPHDAEARAMLSRFVGAMRPLYSSGWATAEDLGVTQQLLDEVFAEQGIGLSVQAVLDRSGDAVAAAGRITAGLRVKVDGIGLADCIGGFGVAEAAAAAARHRGWQLDGMTAVVQGFGSMGGSSARYLAGKGVRVVAVVDVNGCVVNSDGLDVEALLASRTELGEVDRTAIRAGDHELPRERWLDVECDILVPAALADVITEANVDQVKAKLVVEAANIPVTDAAERALNARGVLVVPDYVANGGVNAWFWWVLLGVIEPTPQAAFEHLATIMARTVEDALELADARGITPRSAADEISLRNLDRLAAAYGEEAKPEPVTPAAE